MDKAGELQAGVELFNAGEYFRAHEVWEDLWRATPGPARVCYQGLIHAAVALYHLERGNIGGARSQLSKAIARLEQDPGSCPELDIDGLISQLRSALRQPAAAAVGAVRIARRK